ncbi:MAG TPA: T9SS type A sorting domain-containing protein [Saprospiraceae bacterium]|nr:T9SS type A sorting domain-containing protein [Saprospiraceae bacterium]
MKNVITLFVLVFMISTSAIAQEVSKKQWTLVHERTADWCPKCGTWGWDFKTKLLNEFQNDEVLFMAVHYSGGLLNNTSSNFTSNFTGDGQPIFYADGTDLNLTSNNGAQTLEDAKLIVDFNQSLPPFAGVGMNARLNESTDSLYVDTKVEFINEAEGGDYYLGLYLIEDVTHMQASRTSNELHKNVLRASLLEGTFGKQLVTGSVAVGTSFQNNVKVGNITTTVGKTKIAAIIWNKLPSGRYLFFNANVVSPTLVTPSSTNNFALENQMKVYQIESGDIAVSIDAKTKRNNVSISVTDLSGKLVTASTIAELHQGKQTIQLQGNFTSGMYIVSMADGDQVTSKKLMIP